MPHDWGGLVWCFEGMMTAHVADHRWLLTPRDAVWLPPYADCDVVPNRPSRAIYVQWNQAWPMPSRRVRVDRATTDALHALWSAGDAATAGAAWGRVLDGLRPVTDDGLRIAVPRDPRGRDLAVSLMSDPADDRTLPEWGETTYASAKTLQRIVQRETGMSFPRWRTQIRLNASLPLLADGVSVQDAAAGVGYRSSVGFIDAFAGHFGLTPARFYG